MPSRTKPLSHSMFLSTGWRWCASLLALRRHLVRFRRHCKAQAAEILRLQQQLKEEMERNRLREDQLLTRVLEAMELRPVTAHASLVTGESATQKEPKPDSQRQWVLDATKEVYLNSANEHGKSRKQAEADWERDFGSGSQARHIISVPEIQI